MAPTASSQPSFNSIRFRRVLLLTWIGYAAYSMGRRPFTVVRSSITKDTGLGVGESGWIDTAFLATYTIGQLGYNEIQRRSGLSAHTLLMLGLLGSAIAVALQGVSSSSFGFVLGAALNGLLQAVGWASCMVVVTPWVGAAERGRVMGLWGTTMAAGGILGNFVTPVAMEAYGHWRGGVLAVAAIMATVAIVMRVSLAWHPNAHGFLSPSQIEAGVQPSLLTERGQHVIVTREGERIIDGDRMGAPSKPLGGVSSRELLAIPGVMGICSSYFFAKLVRYVLMFWLPFYFTEALHYKPAAAGMLASVLDLGGVVGTVGSGLFCDRYFAGKRRTEACLWLNFFLALCLGGFALGSDVLASHEFVTVAFAFGCGAFSYGVDAVMSTTLLQDFGDRRGVQHQLGAISGLVGGIGALGSVLQGPFTVLFAALSWAKLFSVLQGLTVVSMVCLLTLWQMERRHAHPAVSSA